MYCKVLTIERLGLLSETNVSPDEQSTPNKAQISPADVPGISYIKIEMKLYFCNNFLEYIYLNG